MLPSDGCLCPLPLASNRRKQDPRLRNIVSQLKQQENHQLLARVRHPLPSLHSACDGLCTAIGYHPLWLAGKMEMTRSLMILSPFVVVWGWLLVNQSHHNYFHDDIRLICIQKRNKLPVWILAWPCPHLKGEHLIIGTLINDNSNSISDANTVKETQSVGSCFRQKLKLRHVFGCLLLWSAPLHVPTSTYLLGSSLLSR